MKHPDIAKAEYEAGRGTGMPSYANEISLARWLGITPWELQDAPIYWYQRIQVFIEAEYEAHSAARAK